MEQASWLDMKFELNPESGFISLFKNFSVDSKVVANANNDAAGQNKKDTIARDLTTIAIEIKIVSTEKINACDIAVQWDAHIGDYAPLYIAGQKFMFENFQLTGCKWNPKIEPDGYVSSVSINLDFTEYAPEKAASKKPSTTSNKKSGSSSKKSTGKKPMEVDKDAVSKADKRVNGYQSKVAVGASPADKKG